jgi:ribosome maturation factor RimP
MTHPLIPSILELAEPVAHSLGLKVVGIIFQTNNRPPVLRVDIRNLKEDTGLNDCEQMSRSLEEVLDSQEIIPGAYVLEVSSPGVSRQLTSDREFEVFKGFAVIVKTFAPFQGQKELRGNLQGQDQSAIYLNQKGKALTIPRELVALVQLEG